MKNREKAANVNECLSEEETYAEKAYENIESFPYHMSRKTETTAGAFLGNCGFISSAVWFK